MFLGRREAEIHQQNVASFWRDQNIGGPQISMDDVSGIDARQCIGEAMCDSQAAWQVRTRTGAQNGLERFAGEVFQNRRQTSTVIDQRKRFGNASEFQRLKEHVFAPKTSGLCCAGVLGKELHKHRRPIRQAAGTVKGGARRHTDPINDLIICNNHRPPCLPGGLDRHLHAASRC